LRFETNNPPKKVRCGYIYSRDRLPCEVPVDDETKMVSSISILSTAAYYVFRHFSQYIIPGATRSETSGNNDALAFKNPNGSIITQIYNQGDSSKAMIVEVRSELYQLDVSAHGWAPLRVRL
jgi:hypothetical protein